MNRTLLTGLTVLLAGTRAMAQYAPQAGIAGSDAVPKSSPSISAWATQCRIVRGLQQIGSPAGGYAQSGDSSLAVGNADGSVVSLGDSGIAILTFPRPIINGTGPDFAVFENGFANPDSPEEAFLELAFVEVSSDGANFFRFPAASLTQDTAQISSTAGMNYMNARKIHNLAGKYVGSWGTPFDLQELAGTPGLNINNVTHVRVVDVIGDITQYKSYDGADRVINEPFPTAFPTGGFDLDAVAILNSAAAGIGNQQNELALKAWPNPVADKLFVSGIRGGEKRIIRLSDITGHRLYEAATYGDAEIPMSNYAPGMYYLSAQDENGGIWTAKVYRQ